LLTYSCIYLVHIIDSKRGKKRKRGRRGVKRGEEGEFVFMDTYKCKFFLLLGSNGNILSISKGGLGGLITSQLNG
jgi:hypothetical protein